MTTEASVEELKEMGFEPNEDGTFGQQEAILEEEDESLEEEESEEEEDTKDISEEVGDQEEENSEEEEESSSEEKEESEEEKEKEEEESKEEKSDDNPYADILAEYELEDVDDLKEVLNSTKLLADDLEKYKSRIEELEKKPKFESKKQEKIFEFLTKYDFKSMGEGLAHYANLVTADIETMDNKTAMRERYILENQDLTREEAIELFEDEYSSSYKINPDDYDSDEEYNKRKKILDIKFQKAANNAKKFLAEESEKFKVPDGESDTEEKTDKKNDFYKLIEKSRESYKDQFSKAMEGFDSVVFSVDGKKDSEFNFKLDKNRLNAIHSKVNAFLDQDNVYNEKGELAYKFNPEEQKINFAIALYGKEIIAEAIKHGMTLGSIDDIKEKAKVKPDRKTSTASGNKIGSGDPFMDQFEALAEKEARKRRSQM